MHKFKSFEVRFPGTMPNLLVAFLLYGSHIVDQHGWAENNSV